MPLTVSLLPWLHGFGQHTATRLWSTHCTQTAMAHLCYISYRSLVNSPHRSQSLLRFFLSFFSVFFFSFLFVFFVFSSFFPFVMIGPRSTQSTVAIPVSMKQSSVEVSRLRWQAPALTLATEIDFVGRQPRRRFQVQ